MAAISSNDHSGLLVGRRGKTCQTLSISLADEDPVIQWDLLVEVRRGEGGFVAIANIRSVQAGTGPLHPKDRLLAILYCPGAIEWQVTPYAIETTFPAGKDIRAELDLACEDCCAAVPCFLTQYAVFGPSLFVP